MSNTLGRENKHFLVFNYEFLGGHSRYQRHIISKIWWKHTSPGVKNTLEDEAREDCLGCSSLDEPREETDLSLSLLSSSSLFTGRTESEEVSEEVSLDDEPEAACFLDTA
jgi:hypothetical protein